MVEIVRDPFTQEISPSMFPLVRSFQFLEAVLKEAVLTTLCEIIRAQLLHRAAGNPAQQRLVGAGIMRLITQLVPPIAQATRIYRGWLDLSSFKLCEGSYCRLGAGVAECGAELRERAGKLSTTSKLAARKLSVEQPSCSSLSKVESQSADAETEGDETEGSGQRVDTKEEERSKYMSWTRRKRFCLSRKRPS